MAKQKPLTPSSAPASCGARLSVTLPPDHYREMQHLASRKKVSMAWVVRDAVDQYLAAHGAPKSGLSSALASGRAAPKRGVV